MTTPDPDALRLPDGTRLVHIGPHKTGTTALQAALWAARPVLLEQGVRAVGRSRNPVSAVRAVTGQASSYSEHAPPMRDWHALVHEIRTAAEPRVVVSSEFFAHADTDAIRRIADDLDVSRLHVAVTLRPLARVIPSMWQQNVQAGTVTSFERWLEGLFPEPPRAPNAAFWTLHRHDALIERWVAVVGADHVTAIVVDDRDHALVLRVFERLLGLRDGTLELESDLSNRSLTLAEAEAVRAFNVAFRDTGLDRALHARVMRYGAATHMKLREPGHDDPPIEIPAWAIDPIGTVASAMIGAIAASGVRVVGDLAELSWTPQPRPGVDAATPSACPPAVAASMATGVLLATGAVQRERLAGSSDSHPGQAADRVPTYQVAGTIALRWQQAMAHRWRQATRWLRGIRGGHA
jgi:hypothetical protein